MRGNLESEHPDDRDAVEFSGEVDDWLPLSRETLEDMKPRHMSDPDPTQLKATSSGEVIEHRSSLTTMANIRQPSNSPIRNLLLLLACIVFGLVILDIIQRRSFRRLPEYQ